MSKGSIGTRAAREAYQYDFSSGNDDPTDAALRMAAAEKRRESCWVSSRVPTRRVVLSGECEREDTPSSSCTC